MKFRVNGNVTYRYSEKKDQYYSTYEVTKIYRVDDDADVSSEVNIDFYFIYSKFIFWKIFITTIQLSTKKAK